MINVDTDNQLLIQDSGWQDGDDVVINDNPTYPVRGIYFPDDFVSTSGRTKYTTSEMRQEQYVNDSGTLIIVTYWVTITWLTEVGGVVPPSALANANSAADSTSEGAV